MNGSRGRRPAYLVVCARLLLIGLGLAWTACSPNRVEVPSQPSLESLGLSAAERERYAPVDFDPLLDALEVAGDDGLAVETIIERVNRKTVGWSGVVQSNRVVKKGREKSEFSLAVASPKRAAGFFPKTIPVLFEARNSAPVASLSKGDVVVFVGRLEFDGLTREPWVIGARRVPTSSDH